MAKLTANNPRLIRGSCATRWPCQGSPEQNLRQKKLAKRLPKAESAAGSLSRLTQRNRFSLAAHQSVSISRSCSSGNERLHYQIGCGRIRWPGLEYFEFHFSCVHSAFYLYRHPELWSDHAIAHEAIVPGSYLGALLRRKRELSHAREDCLYS